MTAPRRPFLERHGVQPPWLLALGCYGMHVSWAPHASMPSWVSAYWNDFWMMPCALPLVLWVYRFVGLRSSEGPATAGEILSHGVLWAFMAEGLAPELFPHSVRDPWDVLAYFLGGLLLFFHGLKGRHSTHHALAGV
jgi:hypothetical protein